MRPLRSRRPPRRRRPSALALAPELALGLALALLASAAAAQSDVQRAVDPTRSSLDTAGLDDVQRQIATAQLDDAAKHEREAADFRTRTAALRTEAADTPARMEQLRKSLALDRDKALEEWQARLPTDADDETLERVLEQERRIITDLGARIDAVGAELAQSLSRPAQAASEIAALRRRAEALSVPVAAPDDEPAAVTEARQRARDAELRSVQAELDLRAAEQETGTQRQRLHELELRELRLRRERHARRVELLEARIADQRRHELESLIASLTERETELADAPPLLADAAKENRALGDELATDNERLARDRRTLADVEEASARVATALRNSRTRLELAGASEAVGRWLWGERRRLESPARLRQQLEQQRSRLAELRLRLVVLNESQRDLLDVDAAAAEMVRAAQAEADEQPIDEHLEAQLVPLLKRRAELLAQLEPLVQRRIATLEGSEEALLEQIADSVALQQLLDRYLLWTPSHTGVDASWLTRVPEGLHDLVKPSRFKTTLELTLRELRARPLPWTASAIALAIGIALRRRAPRRIEADAAATRHVREDSYEATARALGWTLLAAALGPVALALLGALLQSVGTPGRYSDSLGRACVALVAPLFAVQVLRWSTIEHGLGHAHLRWTQSRREALHRLVGRAAAVVLPAYFVTELAFIRNLELPNDVQARLAVVVACVALAVTTWRLLDPGRVWVDRAAGGAPLTLRGLLRVALPALALVVGVLALSGYVYSAGVLMRALLASFEMFVAVAIVDGLLARWFLLGQQRLALRRLEERREAAAQLEKAGADAPPDAESGINLERIDAQTRSLLRALRITLVVLALGWVWAEVLPAIGRLDEIALWHFTDTGEDGSAVRSSVTLMGALLAAVVLALTMVGARNLPGLVEIALLSGRFVDAASRYAITSLLRYAIVIAGTLVGLNLLGLRWSQLQWLAAALTVGLGFGLQEIFANFVSGLILLFERPFRVGDIITVDSLDGRVTRIRTRATTIVDFDNKEIVVPNKNFITGQLVNWTLSDTTTRITVPVGVAYGTAPERVHALLLQAARENPLVLPEPAPMSLFLAFGASSLDFELRVYVGTVADRLPVKSRLHMQVAALFTQHGIEIAFPQLDLHVKDVPPGEEEPTDAGTHEG